MVKLLTSSTEFYINSTELTYKNDYSTNHDTIPLNMVDTIELTVSGNTNNVEIALDGIYIKEELKNHTNKIQTISSNANYIWTKDSENIALYFSDYDLYIISLENYKVIQQVEYVYNDGRLKIYNNAGLHGYYYCKLKYNSQNQSNTLSNHQYEESQNKKTEAYIDQALSENKKISKLAMFFNDIILPWLWEIVITLFLNILLLLFVIYRLSFIVYHKYKKNLRSEIFPQEHSWFGDNSPTDIYISVKVFVENTYYEHNLLGYFLSAFLEKPSTYAILGNAGEGKTFSTSRLILAILDCFYLDKSQKLERKKFKKLIPVLLSFSQLSKCNSRDDLIEVVYQKISDTAKLKSNIIGKLLYFRYKQKMINTIESYFDSGRFVIFIDGYDEIDSLQERLNSSRLICEFMNCFHNCSFIITSRPQIYEHEKFANISSENTLYLSPLTKEQIHEFVSKWNYPKGKTCSELFQRIINTQQLEEIVTNPLLLTMITHTYSYSNFPDFAGKTQLYKNCCNCLLSEWEKNKFSRKRIKRYDTIESLDIKLELLSNLAFKIYSTGNHSFSERDVLKIWSAHPTEQLYFHGKTKNVLDELINESGILERTNDIVKFRHNSFYEYFVALYFANNSIDAKELYDNILSNSQIIFFYFSMISDESTVTEFISKNLWYNQLVCDILLERKITNNDIVKEAVEKIINDISYINMTEVQTLGYIAKKYSVVALKIKEVLFKSFWLTEEKERVNILIGLMIFCDHKTLSEFFNDSSIFTDLEHLVRYSGESINDFAYTIVKLLNNPVDKLTFIESLARSFRFEAIYNIYKKSEKSTKDLAIAGLLYLTKEPELLNWLANKKFYEYTSKAQKKEITTLEDKYGWDDSKLCTKAMDTLYTLVYLGKKVILDGLQLNVEMIDNKIVFLLCLVISDESGKVYYDLININNIQMKSSIELTYHWNRTKKEKRNKLNNFKDIVDIVTLDRVILCSFIIMIVFMLFIIVSNNIYVFELYNEGWIYKSIETGYSLIPFNTLYLILLGVLFLTAKLFNSLLKKFDYSFATIVSSIAFSLVIFIIYSNLVKDIVFRLLTLLFFVFLSFLEIIKHKNNYPSLKEPQYSKITNFLNNSIMFNDIHIG